MRHIKTAYARLACKVRSFAHETRGAIFILAAVGIMLLVVGFKLAIDMGTSYTSQSNIQQTLRNSLTGMAQELVYMWLRCETGATDRPNNILTTCVNDEAALAILRGALQREIQGTKETFADAQVQDMRILNRPEGIFLYARASFELSSFLPDMSGNTQGGGQGMVESAKLLVDLTPGGGGPGPGGGGGRPGAPPDGAVYAVLDSSSNSIPGQEVLFTDALSLAMTALTNRQYTSLNVVTGAMRYASRAQCPQGGCGSACTQTPGAGYGWDGSCSADNVDASQESGGPSVAVQDRLTSVEAEFYAQPIRTCPSGQATWTFKERASTDYCKQKYANSDFTCSYDYEDNCRDEDHDNDITTPDQEVCDRHRDRSCSACNHSPGSEVRGGSRNGGKSKLRCDRCTGGDWWRHRECWDANYYREVVWYHTCNQLTVLLPGRGGVGGAGFNDLYVDVSEGNRLRFIAKYIGDTPDGEPSDYPNMPPLQGVVSDDSEGMPAQTGELRSLMRVNSREMIPWQCSIRGSGAPGRGGNIVMQEVHGGQAFYSPTPDRVADCISGNARPKPYKVTFTATGCDLLRGNNCDIKQGYWKVYAVPNLRGPWTADPMRSNVILGGGGSGPLGPGSGTTGNCDRSKSWCSEQTSGACNGLLKNDQAGTRVRLDHRYSDPVIAQPPYVLGEQIYMSSLSFESGRPDDVIQGVYLDKFDGNSPDQPSFQKGDRGVNKVRFPTEFGAGDGMLVLNPSDNGREIPIGMLESGQTIGNNAGGTSPKSAPLIQSVAALKGADGITPLNNLPMGADVSGLIGFVNDTRDYSRIPSNYNYASCAAFSGAKRELLANYGAETTPVILYGMNCRFYPPEDATYRVGAINWGSADNDLYKLMANGRMQTHRNAAFGVAETWECVEEAATELKNRGGLVFPINIGSPNIHCPDHQQALTSDYYEDTKIGQEFSKLDGSPGHTREDLAADLAWMFLRLDKGLFREVTADNKMFSRGL